MRCDATRATRRVLTPDTSQSLHIWHDEILKGVYSILTRGKYAFLILITR